MVNLSPDDETSSLGNRIDGVWDLLDVHHCFEYLAGLRELQLFPPVQRIKEFTIKIRQYKQVCNPKKSMKMQYSWKGTTSGTIRSPRKRDLQKNEEKIF